MNEITQYRPAFFEGFENETVDFDNLEDLLKIPFVANFTTNRGFNRFSVSGQMLMAEYHNGKKWLVVGYIKNPEGLGLPEWKEVVE